MNTFILRNTSDTRATGKPFHVAAMTMFRLIEGRIVEEWSVFDNYAFLSQLGLTSKPAS